MYMNTHAVHKILNIVFASNKNTMAVSLVWPRHVRSNSEELSIYIIFVIN